MGFTQKQLNGQSTTAVAPAPRRVRTTNPHERATSSCTTSRYSRVGLTVLFVSLLLAAFCAFKGATTLERTTKPIEQIRTGQALPWNVNPTGEEDWSFGKEIVPEDWRNVVLRSQKSDGSWADVELMYPTSWLEERGARPGGKLTVLVPECGIDGEAEVIRIEPCPEIPVDEKVRIVTGTFKHHNARVVDVALSDGTTVGSTPNHRWWSEDRRAFVRAEKLRTGEKLHTIDGASASVVSVVPRPDRHAVYNLQVHFSHVRTSPTLVGAV